MEHFCDAGTFGDNCIEFCHCQGQPCNYTTGECVGGCKQNWTEKQCDVCDSDHYGLLCNATCSNRHCDQTNGTSRCDNITGQCDYGCQPGYTGTDCTQKCRAGMFGSGCKLNCSERHCDGDNTTCDAQNRTCEDGCKPGWKKPSCMEPCDTGLYGASCAFNCTRRHCLNKNASCDHENGSCGGQCEESWMGDDCIDCDETYGRDCSYSCRDRKCRNSSAKCDHVTGSCGGTCQTGWKGDACTQTVEPESGTQVVLIASIAVAAVVVIAVVVIVVVFLRWRRKLRTENINETLVLGRASRSKGKTHEAIETNVYVNVGMTSTLKEQPICHQPEYIPVVAVQQRVKARGEPPKGGTKDKVKRGNTYYNVEISDPHDEDITDAVAIIDADDKSDEGQTENDVPQHNAYYNKPFSLPEVGFDMTELESLIQQIRNQRGGFEAEFLKLPSGFKHPYVESQKPQHKGKNRFVGYYPYDNNRVVLSKLPNYPDSDYINASHVDAYNKKDYFIAAQEYLIILMEQMENRQKKLKSHPVTIVFNVSDTKQVISLCIMNNIMSTISVDKMVEIFNNVRRFLDVLPNVEFTEDTFVPLPMAFVYLESTGIL
ncbi:tenascin-like [Gigantopelta aegis]|uniref:tenascin-like n=1 Tax=Gigantopelta aegis TaxID=1735272 RepID=UPI001B88B760|nr:tenascin-like [Gigantopelta aegis]